MIISFGRRFVFVHIPKTGGTALARVLETRALKDDILIGDTPKAVRRRRRLRGLTARGRLWKHSRLADIDGIVSADELRGMHVLTLVRNPWDRMVSYYHWLRVQGFEHPAVDLAGKLSFGDFLVHPVNRAAMRNDNVADYLRDAHGAEVAAHVARLERLRADLAPLWPHLGFDPGDIPVENASARDRDYRVYYDAEGRDAVAADFARDIERFGYGFDDARAPR